MPQRDIRDPIYPQKVAVEITEISNDVLWQWQSRGTLAPARLDGDFNPPKPQGTSRRFYSVMDLLKLCVVRTLIALGARTEVAIDASALLESALTSEDRKALARGEIFDRPLVFPLEGGALGVLKQDEQGLYFLQPSGPKQKPEDPPPAFVIWWSGIAKRVFNKLDEFDRQKVEANAD